MLRASIYAKLANQQNLTRDAIGRITEQSEVFLGEQQFPKTYAYTAAGQLASVTQNGVTTTWQYDINGNRLQSRVITVESAGWKTGGHFE